MMIERKGKSKWEKGYDRWGRAKGRDSRRAKCHGKKNSPEEETERSGGGAVSRRSASFPVLEGFWGCVGYSTLNSELAAGVSRSPEHKALGGWFKEAVRRKKCISALCPWMCVSQPTTQRCRVLYCSGVKGFSSFRRD